MASRPIVRKWLRWYSANELFMLCDTHVCTHMYNMHTLLYRTNSVYMRSGEL